MQRQTPLQVGDNVVNSSSDVVDSYLDAVDAFLALSSSASDIAELDSALMAICDGIARNNNNNNGTEIVLERAEFTLTCIPIADNDE